MEVGYLIHGTTIGTNAIVEGKGGKIDILGAGLVHEKENRGPPSEHRNAHT